MKLLPVAFDALGDYCNLFSASFMLACLLLFRKRLLYAAFVLAIYDLGIDVCLMKVSIGPVASFRLSLRPIEATCFCSKMVS